jgi:hypothetical protein
MIPRATLNFKGHALLEKNAGEQFKIGGPNARSVTFDYKSNTKEGRKRSGHGNAYVILLRILAQKNRPLLQRLNQILWDSGNDLRGVRSTNSRQHGLIVDEITRRSGAYNAELSNDIMRALYDDASSRNAPGWILNALNATPVDTTIPEEPVDQSFTDSISQNHVTNMTNRLANLGLSPTDAQSLSNRFIQHFSELSTEYLAHGKDRKKSFEVTMGLLVEQFDKIVQMNQTQIKKTFTNPSQIKNFLSQVWSEIVAQKDQRHSIGTTIQSLQNFFKDGIRRGTIASSGLDTKHTEEKVIGEDIPSSGFQTLRENTPEEDFEDEMADIDSIYRERSKLKQQHIDAVKRDNDSRSRYHSERDNDDILFDVDINDRSTRRSNATRRSNETRRSNVIRPSELREFIRNDFRGDVMRWLNARVRLFGTTTFLDADDRTVYNAGDPDEPNDPDDPDEPPSGSSTIGIFVNGRWRLTKIKHLVGALLGIGATGVTIATVVKNLKKKGDDEDKAERSGFPGERHAILKTKNHGLQRANWMGPGTHVLERLKRDDPPLTPSDGVAKLHDIEYAIASMAPTREEQFRMIRDADLKMLRSLKELEDNNLDSTYNIYQGVIGINTKIKAEDIGLLDKSVFAGELKTINPADKQLIFKNFTELTGYKSVSDKSPRVPGGYDGSGGSVGPSGPGDDGPGDRRDMGGKNEYNNIDMYDKRNIQPKLTPGKVPQVFISDDTRFGKGGATYIDPYLEGLQSYNVGDDISKYNSIAKQFNNAMINQNTVAVAKLKDQLLKQYQIITDKIQLNTGSGPSRPGPSRPGPSRPDPSSKNEYTTTDKYDTRNIQPKLTPGKVPQIFISDNNKFGKGGATYINPDLEGLEPYDVDDDISKYNSIAKEFNNAMINQDTLAIANLKDQLLKQYQIITDKIQLNARPDTSRKRINIEKKQFDKPFVDIREGATYIDPETVILEPYQLDVNEYNDLVRQFNKAIDGGDNRQVIELKNKLELSYQKINNKLNSGRKGSVISDKSLGDAHADYLDSLLTLKQAEAAGASPDELHRLQIQNDELVSRYNAAKAQSDIKKNERTYLNDVYKESYPVSGSESQQFKKIQSMEHILSTEPNTNDRSNMALKEYQNWVTQYGDDVNDRSTYYLEREKKLNELFEKYKYPKDQLKEEEAEGEDQDTYAKLPDQDYTAKPEASEHFERADELIGGEALALAQTKEEQMKEQIRWNNFQQVQPGHGLGRNNTLFRENRRADNLRYGSLKPPPMMHRPLPPIREDPRDRPIFQNVYQFDDEFDDEYEMKSLQHWTYEMPNQTAQSNWENRHSIYYPDHSLDTYKGRRAVMIPRLRNNGAQRYTKYDLSKDTSTSKRGINGYANFKDHIPYDNAFGFDDRVQLDPYEYELAKK